MRVPMVMLVLVLVPVIMLVLVPTVIIMPAIVAMVLATGIRGAVVVTMSVVRRALLMSMVVRVGVAILELQNLSFEILDGRFEFGDVGLNGHCRKQACGKRRSEAVNMEAEM